MGREQRHAPDDDEAVEVKIARKEDAQTSVYYKDNLEVDLSTLLDITEGAGAVTYTLISAEGEIKGSVLSCPLQCEYEIQVTVTKTDTHKGATGEIDGPWV